MRPLLEVLQGLGAPRVLVVGDLILDRYLTGVVERISPEAPIQVLRVESETERIGGAGAVAVYLAVLGARPVLVGLLGEDAAARRVAELARAQGVDLRAAAEAGRRTSVKTRHLARSHSTAQQVLRVDEETVDGVGPAARTRLEGLLTEALGTAELVLVNDYGKGLLAPDLLAWLLRAARARGLPVLVDPYKGSEFSRYRGATGLTPNRPEAEAATGVAVADLAGAEAAATRLIEALDLDFALVTLDREGMWLKSRGAPGLHLPTTPREVFDVTGAGDMVLAVLGLALAAGAGLAEAAALANVAAGLEVERVGAVPIRRDEIAARLALAGDARRAKLVGREEVAALAARHHAAGRRIVFTNGCFDLLHAGHVRYLAAARAEGEVLVVGVNDDAGVARLKGPERPLNTLGDRLEVLAALACVDHLVVFSEDTPAALIADLAPDVLVKGADWREKGVVGRDLVEARGGRVVLVDLFEGRSTTGLVDRIRGR